MLTSADSSSKHAGVLCATRMTSRNGSEDMRDNCWIFFFWCSRTPRCCDTSQCCWYFAYEPTAVDTDTADTYCHLNPCPNSLVSSVLRMRSGGSLVSSRYSAYAS